MRYVPAVSCARPEQCDAHQINVAIKADTVFDENYPYLDRSFKTRFMRGLVKALLFFLGFFLMYITAGIRIKGRKNLRKNRKILKNGFVTVSNHIHVWDFVGIMLAFMRYKPNVPVWDKNMLGKDRRFVKWVGGIPIPEKLSALKCFSRAVDELLKNKKWVHFYPEGSLWHYYSEIRPFKKGAFTFAVKSNVPVIPLAYTYRKPRGLFRLLRKTATLTLNIGEPLFPAQDAAPWLAALNLCERARSEVMRLAEITEDVWADKALTA